jgi:hypothetical protein
MLDFESLASKTSRYLYIESSALSILVMLMQKKKKKKRA